jgi:hypothetical protein
VTDTGELGIATTFQISEVNDLQVYNGKFYGKGSRNAEVVYRYESIRGDAVKEPGHG